MARRQTKESRRRRAAQESTMTIEDILVALPAGSTPVDAALELMASAGFTRAEAAAELAAYYKRSGITGPTLPADALAPQTAGTPVPQPTMNPKRANLLAGQGEDAPTTWGNLADQQGGADTPSQGTLTAAGQDELRKAIESEILLNKIPAGYPAILYAQSRIGGATPEQALQAVYELFQQREASKPGQTAIGREIAQYQVPAGQARFVYTNARNAGQPVERAIAAVQDFLTKEPKS